MEYSSESEDDIPKSALPVDDTPDRDNGSGDDGPPMTADEYLRRVRKEAKSLPEVFVADTPAPRPPLAKRRKLGQYSFLNRIRIAETPHFAKPDPQWVRDLVFQFASTQQGIVRAKCKRDASFQDAEGWVPATGDFKAWNRLAFDVPASQLPTMSLLVQLDHVRTLNGLTVFDEGLDKVPALDEHGRIPSDLKESASLLADSFLMGSRPEWLFGLLSLILPPLSGETASTIRSLLRKASIARLGLNGPEDERLAKLNVLITILSEHFGQGDAP